MLHDEQRKAGKLGRQLQEDKSDIKNFRRLAETRDVEVKKLESKIENLKEELVLTS